MQSVAALADENVYTKQSKWTTLRGLRGGERWTYFKQHFLIGTIAIVVAVAVVVSLVVTWATRAPDPDLSVVVVNARQNASESASGQVSASLDRLGDGFVKHAGLGDRRLVSIDGTMTVGTNSYTDDSAKIMTMISAGQINAIASPRGTFGKLNQRSYISPLKDSLSGSQIRRLGAAGALVDKSGKPTNAINKAVGLDLSQSKVWSREGALPNGYVLGMANVSNGAADYVRQFVDYLDFE